ncbi:MAG: hypothetical protein QOH17_536, partial [Pseudonocardiales bacterium]|nr:hypothetical protein [Pseudonocardiales bacterium]
MVMYDDDEVVGSATITVARRADRRAPTPVGVRVAG